jgi:hypothetical protein
VEPVRNIAVQLDGNFAVPSLRLENSRQRYVSVGRTLLSGAFDLA